MFNVKKAALVILGVVGLLLAGWLNFGIEMPIAAYFIVLPMLVFGSLYSIEAAVEEKFDA